MYRRKSGMLGRLRAAEADIEQALDLLNSVYTTMVSTESKLKLDKRAMGEAIDNLHYLLGNVREAQTLQKIFDSGR